MIYLCSRRTPFFFSGAYYGPHQGRTGYPIKTKNENPMAYNEKPVCLPSCTADTWK